MYLRLVKFYLTHYMTRISETVIISYISLVRPKRNRNCELAIQRARAIRLRRWRCVAGCLSFVLIQAAL